MLLLEGARLCCPLGGLDGPGDLLVDTDSGCIVAVGVGLGADLRVSRRVDCGGAVLGPGLVDLWAELCDPGITWREDLSSGSEAAAAGGFTTVIASPATDPIVDDAAVMRDVQVRMASVTGARLLQAGALTRGLAGKELAEVGLLIEAGAAVLSDGGRPMADAGVLRRALEYARPFGKPVLLRPIDPALAAGGLMHEGPASMRAGLQGQPAAAEEIAVYRILALARLTGARVHLSHITSAGAVALLRQARAEGLDVTGTAPARNLVLTDHDVESSIYDTRFRLEAPPRGEADRAALLAGLQDGTLLGVHSDHQPRSRVDKEVEFSACQPGATGLESALPAVLSAFAGQPVAALQALCTGPAALLGRQPRLAVGEPADLVLFDPSHAGPLGPTRRSKGVNEPLQGRRLQGRVLATVVGGHIVYGPIPSRG